MWYRRSTLMKAPAGLLLALLCQGLNAEPLDPAVWFQRMSDAFSEQTYDGVFVYGHGDRMDSLRIVHSVVDGVEREHIVRLDGERYELIRNGDQLICVHDPDWAGDIQHQVPSGPFAKAFVGDLTQLNQHYSFAVKSETRVVDREAVGFIVEPKDSYRYGYRVWLDKETGLLLKSLLVNKGRVLERFQFTQLQVGGDIEASELELDDHKDSLVHYLRPAMEVPVAEQADSQWKLNWLPPGFEMTSQVLKREINEEGSADTMTFSDGMAAISVFFDPAGDVEMDDMVAQTGATAAVMRQLDTADGRFSVTVVGEVPLETVKRLAAGVERIVEP